MDCIIYITKIFIRIIVIVIILTFIKIKKYLFNKFSYKRDDFFVELSALRVFDKYVEFVDSLLSVLFLEFWELFKNCPFNSVPPVVVLFSIGTSLTGFDYEKIIIKKIKRY